MYSNNKHVLQLIALLKAHSIDKIVISPGTRNVPIVHSVENDPYFTCYSVVDERSAAFFALGLIMKTQKPVAICCTSGTAVMNYGSAIAEAYYQKLPLLVITADRPAMYLGQNEDQMIPQAGMFNSIVKKYVNIPEAKTSEDVWYCNRLINEAILALNHRGKGPVHINIILWSNLFSFEVMELPKVRTIFRCSAVGYKEEGYKYVEILNKSRKRMLILGQSLPRTEENFVKLNKFIEKYNFVVISDNLANFNHPNVINDVNRLLTPLGVFLKDELKPDIVVTFDGHVLGGIKNFLKEKRPRHNWHVSPDGEIVDQFKSLTGVFEYNTETFIDMFLDSDSSLTVEDDVNYVENWTKLPMELDIENSFSDVAVVQQFFKIIPKNASLHVANSSSIRLTQMFSLDSSIKIFGNRGTHGIDGSLSTAVGYNAVNGGLTFILIGDLSFFYDMNAIWNRHINKNFRVLLNNNGGAGIFHNTMGKKQVPTINTHIAVEHNTSAKAWAESQGFRYLSASDQSELSDGFTSFIEDNQEAPVLFEVFTDKELDASVLRTYFKKSLLTKIQQKIVKKFL